MKLLKKRVPKERMNLSSKSGIFFSFFFTLGFPFHFQNSTAVYSCIATCKNFWLYILNFKHFQELCILYRGLHLSSVSQIMCVYAHLQIHFSICQQTTTSKVQQCQSFPFLYFFFFLYILFIFCMYSLLLFLTFDKLLHFPKTPLNNRIKALWVRC